MAGATDVILGPDAIAGIGFTSQRTRKRMNKRLRERGIENDAVLQVMQSVPCLLYTSPSPRDATLSRMPSSA